MGGGKKKKKKQPEGIDDTYVDPAEAGTVDEASDAGNAEGVESLGGAGTPIDAGGTGDGDPMAGDSLENILADLDDASSPLIPDQIGDEFDPDENDAKTKAEQLNKAKGKSGMSAAAAKRKAMREKKKANKLAAYKAEARVKDKKKDEKRMRTVAAQQNKTARERILRGQTGTRGRMFNRVNAKFQIPDAPINLPGTGGSGTQYN